MAAKAPRKESKHVTQVKDILREKIPKPNNMEIFELVKQLKRANAFGYARKLLERARESLDPESDAQQRLKQGRTHLKAA